MSAISTQTLVIAGIFVNVSSYVPLNERGRPLAVLFLLHGRQESTKAIETVVNNVLAYAQAQVQGPSDRDLVVVTFVSDNSLLQLSVSNVF